MFLMHPNTSGLSGSYRGLNQRIIVSDSYSSYFYRSFDALQLQRKSISGVQWLPPRIFQVDKVASKPLVSGELRTRRNMFRYGRYEVRMKAPDVQPGNPDIDGNWL